MAGYISNGNKTKLNKMNRAAQNVNLGTIIQDLVAGSAVSSASLVAYQSSVVGLSASAVALQGLIVASGSRTATGSEIWINMGLAVTPKGWIVQDRRSGSAGLVPVYMVSGSVASLFKVSGSDVASGDVITYFAFA
jgi:hypothetical protein